jgi:predicted RND superfamily exporter protein
MKTISIRMNYDFSPTSKVILHIGERKEHLKGYRPFSFTVYPDQEFYVSHQWTNSNRIRYNEIGEDTSYLVRPRFGKVLAFVTLIIFMICTVIFIFTRFRWSFMPLVPIALYVVTYVTILRDKYLIIESTKTDNKW